MPLPSGRRMSVRHRLGCSSATIAWASPSVAAVNVRRPIRLRVISSSSRISGSSSTIRTLCGHSPIVQATARAGSGRCESNFHPGRWAITQVRIVDFAQFLAQIQAHATACLHGREKGSKSFVWSAGGTPFPVSITSIRHWCAVKSRLTTIFAVSLPVAMLAVAQCVVQQVGQHTLQVFRVELHQ